MDTLIDKGLSAFRSIRSGISSLAEGFCRHLFHAEEGGASDNHRTPTTYGSRRGSAVLPTTLTQDILEQPASSYSSPYACSAARFQGSTRSLPPSYTPREDLPAYSRSVDGDDGMGSFATQAWRRVSATGTRLSGTRVFVGPFGRPTFAAFVSFRSPRNSTGLPHTIQRAEEHRPRRLDWLPKPVKWALFAAVLAALGVVFFVIEQKWQKSRT